MNHGWYEIMDRLSVFQQGIEDHVRNHQASDDELKRLIDEAQEKLADAYQYAGGKALEDDE